MDELSFLSNADHETIEELYRQYKQDPESIETGWRRFFQGFEFSGKLMPQAETKPGEFKVIDLINEYRKRGHLFTKTNPVRTRRTYSPTLHIDNFGLTEEDREQVFKAGGEIGIGDASLNSIIEHLETTYCQSVGIEYAYISVALFFQHIHLCIFWFDNY